MTKQEFLAMSLPYDLVGITQNRLVIINGINYENQLPIIWDSINKEKSDFSGICGFGIMLILRPLSDLIKEIEHKGERFVPIVRLIEIAFDVEVNPNRVELSFEDDMYIAEINGFEFVFDITDNSLLSFRHNFLSVVPKQLLLFQKLIEWHFDLFGGIENKEAINVNDLKTNPYK